MLQLSQAQAFSPQRQTVAMVATSPTTATTSPTTTHPIYAATTPAKQKSIAAEIFPVLALMLGIPLVVWMVDRDRQKRIG